MTEKYRATIQGDRIEWSGNAPSDVNDRSILTVVVTVVSTDRLAGKPNGNRMAKALANIAARGGIKSIPDPVKWQRKMRRDRPLPGRK
jgi:hypothetical protein